MVIIIGILVLVCLCVGAATGTSVPSARSFGTDSLLVLMAKASVSGVLISHNLGLLVPDLVTHIHHLCWSGTFFVISFLSFITSLCISNIIASMNVSIGSSKEV